MSFVCSLAYVRCIPVDVYKFITLMEGCDCEFYCILVLCGSGTWVGNLFTIPCIALICWGVLGSLHAVSANWVRLYDPTLYPFVMISGSVNSNSVDGRKNKLLLVGQSVFKVV